MTTTKKLSRASNRPSGGTMSQTAEEGNMQHSNFPQFEVDNMEKFGPITFREEAIAKAYSQSHNAALRESHERLWHALNGLRADVHGAISIAELEIKEAIGLTNLNCIYRRLEIAEAALAEAEKLGK